MNSKAILCGFAVFCVAILTATSFLCLNENNSTQVDDAQSIDLVGGIEDGVWVSSSDDIAASSIDYSFFYYRTNEETHTATVIATRDADRYVDGNNCAHFVIPDTIECDGETYVVDTIQNGTFYDVIGCSSFVVSIGPNIRIIEDSAFEVSKYWTVYMESFIIRNIESSQLSEIGECAFYRQRHLPSITLPESLQFIGDSAFRECEALKEVNIDSTAGLRICDSAFRGDKELTTANLGNVTLIENSAFREDESLTTVTLNSTGLEIWESAFRNCYSLNAIDLKYVTVLGDGAFHECNSLSYADLTSIQSIGKTSFRNCPLTYVEVGDGLISLRSDSFYNTAFYDSGGNAIAVNVDNLCGHTFGVANGDGKLVMTN